MVEDPLDSLLSGRSQRRSRVTSGLKVTDILLMPDTHQSLLNWLMRQYEADRDAIAAHLNQDVETVQTILNELVSKGLLKTVETAHGICYRVRLAPKSGRQMPTDIWRVLDSQVQQANVFISYSRRNKAFVQHLHASLEATGREIWVDWENIPLAVDWWKEIELGIEVADTFLFVLSPDSVQSQVCSQEIEHAVKHNKRLVPVVCEDVSPDQVHPELARLNWIFLRAIDDFETGFKGLLKALDRDLDYVRTHTRLLVRALEWDRNRRDSSYLLRGTDLQRANEYLAQGREEEPRPTALHHQYVLASAEAEAAEREAALAQQSATLRNQGRWLQLVTAVSVIAVVLGIFSLQLYRQAQTARQSAERARLRSLIRSAEALFLSDQRFESLLTATQAGALIHTPGAAPENENAVLRPQVMSALQQALFWIQERNRLEGHTGLVWQVAFDPKGHLLASASADGTVRLWSLSGQPLQVLAGNGTPLQDVAFSKVGFHVAAVGKDGGLYLWNQQGTLLQQWQAHARSVQAVRFSPQGDFIATASDDATVKLWRWDGTLIRTLTTGTDSGLHTLAIAPDGQQLIAGDEAGQLHFWSLPSGAHRSQPAHQSAIVALDLSPNGRLLVSASGDRQIQIFDLVTGQARAPISGFEGQVRNVRFTPAGDQLVTVSSDRRIRIWDLEGTLQNTLIGNTGQLAGLAIAPDDDLIATAGGDRVVRLWSRENPRLQRLKADPEAVNTIALAPTGDFLVSGGQDAVLKRWRLDGTRLNSFRGHGAAITAVALNASGDRIASASQDGTVRLWNLQGDTLQILQGHDGAVRDVAFAPQGNGLVSGGDDHTLRFWTADGALRKVIQAHPEGVLSLAFSPDGETLVSTGWDHGVQLWTPDGEWLRSLEGHRGSVHDTAFSPDGRFLATASYDNTVMIWRVADGERLHTLEGHRDGVLSVAFSPLGEMLITAGSDNTLRFWDWQKPQKNLLSTLSGHRGSIHEVVFDPQGRFVASASSDSTVLIWKLRNMFSLDPLLDNSCRWLSDYLRTDGEAEAARDNSDRDEARDRRDLSLEDIQTLRQLCLTPPPEVP